MSSPGRLGHIGASIAAILSRQQAPAITPHPMKAKMSLPEQVAETTQQVNDLFNSVELTNAMGTEDFRHFLDLFPIAVLVSKLARHGFRSP